MWELGPMLSFFAILLLFDCLFQEKKNSYFTLIKSRKNILVSLKVEKSGKFSKIKVESGVEWPLSTFKWTFHFKWKKISNSERNLSNATNAIIQQLENKLSNNTNWPIPESGLINVINVKHFSLYDQLLTNIYGFIPESGLINVINANQFLLNGKDSNDIH